MYTYILTMDPYYYIPSGKYMRNYMYVLILHYSNIEGLGLAAVACKWSASHLSTALWVSAVQLIDAWLESSTTS